MVFCYASISIFVDKLGSSNFRQRFSGEMQCEKPGGSVTSLASDSPRRSDTKTQRGPDLDLEGLGTEQVATVSQATCPAYALESNLATHDFWLMAD